MKRSPLPRRSTPLRKSSHKAPREPRIPLAIPRPSEVREERSTVKIMRDGREICNLLTKGGRDEYDRRKRIMWERQGRKCGLVISPQCQARKGRLLVDEIQFDHSNGRGLGGGKRDDSIIDKDGNAINMAVCLWCNMLKGSRPLSDFVDDPFDAF